MKFISRLLPLLTTAFLVLLLILLAWHCADIYFFTPDSSASIFTYTDVAARLKSILPLVVVCAFLILLTLAAKPRSKSGQPAKRNNFDHRGTYSKACTELRSLLFIRTTLLLIAVVFIVWGVFNGGLYDVFVKAINICTECIGLG